MKDIFTTDFVTEIAWDAWSDLNITTVPEHGLGNAVGRYWVPASQNPFNQTRSYARYGYYDPIRFRENYHLIVNHKAEKLEFDSKNRIKGVVVSDRFDPTQKVVVRVRNGGDAVLAAGAVHTPHILQLSGIGSRALLEEAGVEVKVNLPGVGQNLQDHAQIMLGCNCECSISWEMKVGR